jgi:hypothetical protein
MSSNIQHFELDWRKSEPSEPVCIDYSTNGMPCSDYFINRHTNVLKIDGETFITHALLIALIGNNAIHAKYHMKWGTAKIHSISEILDDILDHATYPRRSDREREVAHRLTVIAEILAEF